VLFQDEKGPIAAKTYGGPSWCSVQAKIEHAQKIKGILNVLGIYYDHTNDKMFTHCYKKRNSHQFLDFIRRVDSSSMIALLKGYFSYLIIFPYIKRRRLEK
jgi:hypothetical protein